jgi:Conjugal transfer protein TraD
MTGMTWLESHVLYLRRLKTRTEAQELLMLLGQKRELTSIERKKLDALVKAEKAAQRAAKAKSAVSKLIQDERKKAAEQESKAEARRLKDLGKLVALAGLKDRSPGEILGALLNLGKIDAGRWESLKATGDAALANQ